MTDFERQAYTACHIYNRYNRLHMRQHLVYQDAATKKMGNRKNKNFLLVIKEYQ